jgi:hypothetical protein
MNLTKIRNILNIAFMLLAVAAVIVFFACKDIMVFAYVCGTAILMKMAESIIRFTDNNKR